MTLDVSLEAIESDLRIAERGGQVGDLAMARAQVRATLLAAQPVEHQGRHEAPETPTGNYITWHDSADIRIEEHPVGVVYLVPTAATWADRVTAAAMLLGVETAPLARVLANTFDSDERQALEPPVVPDEDELAAPAEIDADFFAEAKRARRKK